MRFCASGPKIDASVRISSGNFPGSVRSSLSTAIPKGSNCRSSSGPGFVFHARITSGRSSAITSKFGMKPRPTLGSLATSGNCAFRVFVCSVIPTSVSILSIIRIHSTPEAESDTTLRTGTGIWTLLPKESVTTVSGPCAQVAEHIAKTRTANHPRMRFTIYP